MAPKRQERSSKFNSVSAEYEDEILVAYESILGEEEDLYLLQISEFFTHLQIPNCYTKDVLACVELYYDKLRGHNIKYDADNSWHTIEIQFLQNYTLFSTFEADSSHLFDEVIDIVDIDKLLKRTAKFLFFRDNHLFIKESWGLFIKKVAADLNSTKALDYKLTMPDLQKLKVELGLENELSDGLLIDMLGCCATVNGEIVNYDFSKISQGKFVAIRDFAEILGQIGEFD